MSVASDRIVQQIGIVNAAIKRPFDPDPVINERSIRLLADYLVANGTTSILDLAQYKNADAHLSFFYDNKTAHTYFNPLTFGYYDPASSMNIKADDLFAELDDGDNRRNRWVYLKFTSDGFPVFIIHTVDLGSDWVSIRGGILFITSIAVAFALPALGANIGAAVLGPETAAAYPSLASTIGNAAVNTALNGGDIEKGVTSAIGGTAGAFVGGATASISTDAIGKAAGAATSALITGGDLQTAVLSSFVKSGVQGAATMFENDLFPNEYGLLEQPLAPNVEGAVYDYSFGGGGSMFDANGQMITGYGSLYGTQPIPSGMIDGTYNFGEGILPPYDFDFGSMPGGYDFSTPGINPPISPSSGGMNPSTSNVTGDATIAALSQLALAALKVFAPNIAVRAGVSTSSTGATQQANANGTVTTRSPTGQITVARPQAGTAYTLPDGGTVMNNGNGTYTVVSPSGQVTTKTYGASGASGSGMLSGLPPNTLLFAGIGLVAILLLKK